MIFTVESSRGEYRYFIDGKEVDEETYYRLLSLPLWKRRLIGCEMLKPSAERN